MAEKSAKVKAPGKSAGKKTKSAQAKAGREATQAKAVKKPAKKKTAFKLHAPEATQVFVAGCFNDWNPAANPLVQDEAGTWTCTVMLEPGEHQYRFVVDGAWCDDPMALERRPNDFGCENCIIIV